MKALFAPERGNQQGSRPRSDPKKGESLREEGRGTGKIKPKKEFFAVPLLVVSSSLRHTLVIALVFFDRARSPVRRRGLSAPFRALSFHLRSPCFSSRGPFFHSPLSLSSFFSFLLLPPPPQNTRQQAPPPLDPRAPRPLPQGPRRPGRPRGGHAGVDPPVDEHRRARAPPRQISPADIPTQPQPRDRRERRRRRSRRRERKGTREHGGNSVERGRRGRRRR